MPCGDGCRDGRIHFSPSSLQVLTESSDPEKPIFGWSMPAKFYAKPGRMVIYGTCLAAKRSFATFLLCLKETFADPSEILACKWVELQDNVLFINHPVKRHNPGHYELTDKLVIMLNALPRKDEQIFPWKYKNVANNMRNLRQRVAKKFNEPAVLQISLKSFRHWGGTMLAYATNGNVPKMARALRHKDWKSTQRYTHILDGLVDDDFDVTSATTLPEILELGKNGWQKYDEVHLNGVVYHCYRKPKRFGSLKNEKSQNYGDKSQNSGDSLICA